MLQQPIERQMLRNFFGIVTTHRVTYLSRQGWFSQGSRADSPLGYIKSVQLETNRNFRIVVALGVVGMAVLFLGLGTIGTLAGVILLANAAMVLWGSPTVVVTTTGGDLTKASGRPWQRVAAEAFVTALRRQLRRDGDHRQ